MKLRPGELYFVVSFKDEALTLPLIRTLVCRQAVSRGDGSTGYLFDQISDGEAEAFFVEETHIEELIVDRQGLLRMLELAFKGTLPAQAWKSRLES